MGIICMNMCVCKVSKCMYEHHFTKSIHTHSDKQFTFLVLDGTNSNDRINLSFC